MDNFFENSIEDDFTNLPDWLFKCLPKTVLNYYIELVELSFKTDIQATLQNLVKSERQVFQIGLEVRYGEVIFHAYNLNNIQAKGLLFASYCGSASGFVNTLKRLSLHRKNISDKKITTNQYFTELPPKSPSKPTLKNRGKAQKPVHGFLSNINNLVQFLALIHIAFKK